MTSTFAPNRHPASPTSAREQEDERELAGYAPSGSAADQQAAAWLLRQHGGLDAAGEAELQVWLRADIAHRAAFARHRSLWAELDALPAEQVKALKAGLPHHEREPSPLRPADIHRRAWLAGIGRLAPQAAMAAVAFAAIGGGWMGYEHWQKQPTFTKTYATSRGQLVNVTLPDGSRLHLDTATRAEARLYRQRREVRLPEGQVLFAVHANPAQPFDVLAGPLRITVLGTRFSVRYIAGDAHGGVQVAVEEGRVRIAQAGMPADRGMGSPDAAEGILLTAGQAIASDAQGRLGTVSAVAAPGVAPWREGRVAFDNTPLSQALAEFERYGDTSLRIGDPAVGQLRLSGSFDVRKADNFAHALTRALPVALRKEGDVTEIVLAR
jgi:transmembrane sensor